MKKLPAQLKTWKLHKNEEYHVFCCMEQLHETRINSEEEEVFWSVVVRDLRRSGKWLGTPSNGRKKPDCKGTSCKAQSKVFGENRHAFDGNGNAEECGPEWNNARYVKRIKAIYKVATNWEILKLHVYRFSERLLEGVCGRLL